jgi:hypothetical protein
VPLIPLSLRGLQHIACRFIINTHIQLITNTAISRLYRYCSHPVIFLLQGRYFKGIGIPVNSSLHPSKYPPMFYYFSFSKPTSGAFCTKVLFHAFGNKDFVICFFTLLFFFGENLYRYKNILLKSTNNIFAIPSGHGIEAPSALSCSLHRLFVKLVFQNVFRGKTI